MSTRREFALPGARPHYNPDRPGNVEHIALDLAIDLEAQRASGTCRIRLRCVADQTRVFSLDAVELQIEAVHTNGNPADFDHDGAVLWVRPAVPPVAGEVVELAIDYRVEKPRRGIYFVGPDADYPDKSVQVWTQGEDEDSRFWFPCFDYPGQLATSEVRVRVPARYQTVSNGVLTSIEEHNGSKIYHWRQAQVHPCYLITLVVAELSEIQDRWEDIPTPYYVTPGREEEARRTFAKTPSMVAFFSERFGVRYPFARYAQVCAVDFIFGGMENTGATTQTDRCLLDEQAAREIRWPEDLVCHELVHQWFGDLVVIRHWSHAWIKEGAATYFESLWREHEYGSQDAAYYRYQTAQAYFEEDSERYRRPIVTNVYKEPIELYDRHLYEKASTVYHMLRHYLGDAAFFRAVQTFLSANAHRTVETVDLLQAIEAATGRNMLPLFEQYVFKAGHPQFKVRFEWDSEAALAKVEVSQTQIVDEQTVLFDLVIHLGFGFAPDTQPKCVPVRIRQKEQTFCFPFEQKPLYFSFDPGNPVLKTVELEVPPELLKNQLAVDPELMGRIFAAQALAKQLTPDIAQALGAVLLDENQFWGLRAEVAKALGSTKKDYAYAVLREAAGVGDLRARAAAIKALAEDKSPEAFAAIRPGLVDPSYTVSSEAARAVGKAKHADSRALLIQVLASRPSWNDTVGSAALAGLAELKDDPEAIEAILERTRRGTPQALRMAAIRALGSAGEGGENQKILDALAQIAQETQFSTRRAVIAALGSLKSSKALPLLEQIAREDPDGRVRRSALESAESIRSEVGQDKELKKLREAVESLQEENRSLKSRLEVLESRLTSP
ncbi:M1 family aminopeptidase [Gloeobacter violaceus]|uniref:Aminopeptidase N n=1 Tax=Gloeobacter violaceus (strain ATCC 29082 / PCC 7421) TaxID=251221 RepID=Q7NGU9_GLOVI|nr:M1 family aminopeptidase [Gloeobacter violaceus]BAC90729.1 aminopeptidase [Gloeobacter violaceus PCC 7421]